ncbi:integrator complex subunit 7 [Cimex lectularius]|uniref:Integrator complex subunit 7 n=1 Tax=Cimex lectularius TaxID=79782 RepID=A0A8I6TB87_CIMLE|nr:integrator complex subunit 7 [Cimex lectularius]
MSTFKFSSFTENATEPDQDANSALTELDKGLRSGKVGEQCEAIVRFPRLFEKYPFPILINSSFLKLADVFRVGNNFLRLWVLRVCQQSEKHLDKILNVDEFVKRIFSVIHSNDPVARALTLQTLGSIAGVIPNRQQVHHNIRRCLDSHDSVEVEAAIYAAMQFAAQSKSFALGMCDKISDMIQGIATPAHLKLLLIPILQYMHHDTSSAAMVRKVCTDLLPKYPAKDFVVTTLNTLTKLAAATLVDIPNQVELLLHYLTKDRRWPVKKASLLGLHQLAKVGPHLWPQKCVTETIQVARNSKSQGVVMLALDIFIVLTQSSVICKEYVESDSELMQLCQATCFSHSEVIPAKSVKIITHMVKFCYEEGQPITDVEKYISLVEMALLILKTNRSNYQCAITICKLYRSWADRFIDLVATQLAYSKESCFMICEALAGIGGLEPQALEAYLPEILEKIKEVVLNSNQTEKIKTKCMLCTLVFQTVRPSDWDSTHQEAITSIIENTDLWANYKIARAAARYGHFGICRDIILKLKGKVSSEHHHFWIIALEHLSNGEAALVGNAPLTERLGQAIAHYNTAIASLRAGSIPSHNMSFQCEYALLRSELLQCFHQLVVACHSLCFSPPPAIAATIVTASRDDLQCSGHITNQLRKCAKEFRSCGEAFWKLYQSAFDADPISLTNIQILQHMCMVMTYSIESISTLNYQGEEPALDFSHQYSSLETQVMLNACKAASLLHKTFDNSVKAITHQHIECLLQQVELLIASPFCLPRFFFQVLQSTSVKLAVSPQPKVSGEWIIATSGTQLAVKVEGVIQHASKPGLFRSVEKVMVTLNCQGTARVNANDKTPEMNLMFTQTVVPHRDFFSAQFLVSLGSGSVQATVTVTAAVVDETGAIWQTGPKSTLILKQHDEAIGRVH